MYADGSQVADGMHWGVHGVPYHAESTLSSAQVLKGQVGSADSDIVREIFDVCSSYEHTRRKREENTPPLPFLPPIKLKNIIIKVLTRWWTADRVCDEERRRT